MPKTTDKADENTLKARKALAARYKQRGMDDAARHVTSGAWDGEPFMLALVDVLSA